MNTLLFIAVTFVCVFTLVMGVMVLIKNTKATPNRRLFWYAISLAIWIQANYLSNLVKIDHQILYYINLVVFLSAGLTMVFMHYLIESMVSDVVKLSKHRRKYINFFSIGILLAPTPLVVAGIQPQENFVAITFGPLALFYFISVMYFMIHSTYLSYRAIRAATGIQRARMQVIFFGVSTSFLLIILANIVLPFLFGSYYASLVLPIFAAFMVGSFGYSIIKQRLFEIRGALIVSLISIILIGLLSVLYIGILSVIGDHHDRKDFNSSNLAIYGVDIIVALSYWPLYQVLKDIGFRLFYRDIYNPREAIDELSDAMIRNIDEGGILKNTLRIANKYLHASFILYIPSYGETEGVGRKLKNTQKIKALLATYPTPTNSYIKNDISPSAIDEEMARQSIEVITPVINGERTIGHLVLGVKISGRAYSQQDVEFLNITARSLGLAIVNAEQYERIVNFSNTLKSEIRKATNDLRNSNNELALAIEAKEEFLSMATHQIYPQLTAAMGFIDILSQDNDNEEEKQSLQWARTGVNRSIQIISDMLSLSQFSSNQLVISRQSFDLVKMIRQELASLNQDAKSRNINVVFDPDIASYMIDADKNKLREVVSNLCRNAIQYSRKSTSIRITLRKTKKNIIFEVVDTAKIIDEEDRKKLFNKFFRTKQALEQRPAGSGIGLFLTKKVIVAHGGTVYHKPSVNGKHNVFGFKLPLN